MDIVIPVFPGDFQLLCRQCVSIHSAFRNGKIDEIHVILIIHRRDFDKAPALRKIFTEATASLLMNSLIVVSITLFSELFPGQGGHSNSATAKHAAILAFAGQRTDAKDILFLLDGEILVDKISPEARLQIENRLNFEQVTAGLTFESIRLRQALQALGCSGENGGAIPATPRGSFVQSGTERHAINHALSGGLVSVAKALLDGQVLCNLADLHHVWSTLRSCGMEEEWQFRSITPPAQPFADSSSDDLVNKFERSAAIIARLEEFDAKLAHRAIANLVQKNDQITFIQVGANDGRIADPIEPFVGPESWSGLVIEPVPAYFLQLEERYANFPNVLPLQIAIGRTVAERPIYFVDERIIDEREEFPSWFNGIASFSLDHVLQHGVSRDFISRVFVQCAPGHEIVRRHLNGPFDLLVIDVEGAELEVIESFKNLDPGPSCIIFESEHLNESDEVAIRLHLTRCGYRIIWARPDAVALRDQVAYEHLIVQQQGKQGIAWGQVE